MKKISVCVPTYNRPETLRQLIASFLKQDYPNKELIISDDTQNDSVKKVVDSFDEKTIKYFHNNHGLGFSKNLKKSLQRANGNYIIILGDDDILFTPSVLSNYVSTFEKNPSVGFVYSNIVQISNNQKVEYIIRFVLKDKVFKKGQESFRHTFIKSMFIGGIGLRNIKSILKYYPSKSSFYPQMELIGHIINRYDSVILSEINIGLRSNNDHFIFQKLKKKKDNIEGSHITVEILEIYERLKKIYKLKFNSNFLVNYLINFQVIMMFKERKNIGSKNMNSHYREFCELSEIAAKSLKLKIACILANIAPPMFVDNMRMLTFYVLRNRNKSEYMKYEKMLTEMISNY